MVTDQDLLDFIAKVVAEQVEQGQFGDATYISEGTRLLAGYKSNSTKIIEKDDFWNNGMWDL